MKKFILLIILIISVLVGCQIESQQDEEFNKEKLAVKQTAWAIQVAKQLFSDVGYPKKSFEQIPENVRNAVYNSVNIKVDKRVQEYQKIKNEKYPDVSCDISFENIQKGDILLTINRNPTVMAYDNENTFHHAILCISNPKSNEDMAFISIVDTNDTVKYYNLDYIRQHDDVVVVMRHDEITENQIQIICNYVKKQLGKSYNINFINKWDESKFYCSSLVWRAYLQAGLQIDSNNDKFNDYWAVLPSDIYWCNKLKVIKYSF